MNVENVVYAPTNPIAANGRTYRSAGQRARSSVSSTPRTKLPVTLTVKVAHGNPPGPTVSTRPTP